MRSHAVTGHTGAAAAVGSTTCRFAGAPSALLGTTLTQSSWAVPEPGPPPRTPQVAAVCAPFPSHDYELKVQKTEQLEHIVRMCPEAAQGLPDWLRKQGSAHTITVLELRRLAHYRVVKAAMGLMEEARAAGRPLPPPLLRQAKQSAAALVALAPDWPRYLLLQAEVFSAADDLKTAAAINRRVIEAATAQNGGLGRCRVWGWLRQAEDSHLSAWMLAC